DLWGGDRRMAWTRERLEEVAQTRLAGIRLVGVSNREPSLHVYEGDKICLKKPASGPVTALDPVMQACRGVWGAHGSGEADRAIADTQRRVRVTRDNPTNLLHRVWLSKQEDQGYYYGF